MVKKKFLRVAMIVTCIATLILPHTSTVLAAALTNENPNDVNAISLISSAYHEGGTESSESLSDDVIDNYDKAQYEYTFTSGGDATDVLKILREDDKDETTGAYSFSDAFYCLDGNNSFPSINGSIEYNRTITNFFSENPSTLGLSDENYNSLCWLLNNMYLRKQMTAEQREEQKDSLIESAFAEILNDTTYEDTTTIDDIKSTITDDDIEVIQQWAIWYFTNYGEKTIQGVPFTNEDITLPDIDLTTITLSTDSMDNTRYEWCTVLYQYFVKTALENKNVEYTSSSTVTYPKIVDTDLTCTVEGNYYVVGPFKVTAPSSDCEYDIALTDGTSELLSTAYSIKDKDGNDLNGTIDTIFDTEYYIYISTDEDINTLKLNVSYTQYETKASVWQAEDTTYQPLVLLTKEAETHPDSVSVEISNIIHDLALRKYIVAVNDEKITNREPSIDTSGLSDGTSTTAEYEHPKNAVEVEVGDTVTYRIAIYNEGNVEATATGLVDYLPEGLDFVADDETNIAYGWKISDDGRIATTDIVSNTKLSAFGDTLNGTYVDIVCKITSSTSGEILTNIAEIESDDIDDIDSTPNSMSDKISSIDQSTYTGDVDNKADLTDSNYYYKGYEDDDDFEKVIVSGKAFDLSLQKFITKINGKEVDSREPKVDTSTLISGSTDATYTTVKTPLLVQEGDIVTYTIRVYNEGEVSGYAESVADYLPEGLGYLVNYNDNIDNYWAISNDSVKTVKLSTISNATSNLSLNDFTGVTDLKNVDVVAGKAKLTSTALSSSVSSDNLISAFDGTSSSLSYKDIQITCVVLSDSNLKNVAEIVDDADENKNEVTDRDSTPNTVDPDNYPGNDEKQDDNDYESLTMKEFDLALQKFITAVNDTSITDRTPTVSYNNGKITYNHTDTALEVNSGDYVTYTIRVYNEGEIDGYAAEIGDDIPSGLIFDSDNATNVKYGWVMYDSNGNVTTDESKAVEIKTNYLSKEQSEARGDNTLLKALDSTSGTLYYFDVQVVFQVNTTSSNDTITNTAEITKNTDANGNEIEDIDSTPDNGNKDEDDLDQEKVHVGYFDLALKKDLVKAVVTEDSKTTEIAAVNGELMKVEINRKKINSTIVKFVYNITITNEGTIAGYATEIKDYIPDGLQFIESDNTGWTGKTEGVITTNALSSTLLQPGESATVQVVLRWINGDSNLGKKTNIAEISADYNDANDTNDIDSTPNNAVDGEDDIDSAPVILSISTGSAPTYIILSTTVLAIIATGIVLIKKFVL